MWPSKTVSALTNPYKCMCTLRTYWTMNCVCLCNIDCYFMHFISYTLRNYFNMLKLFNYVLYFHLWNWLLFHATKDFLHCVCVCTHTYIYTHTHIHINTKTSICACTCLSLQMFAALTFAAQLYTAVYNHQTVSGSSP